MFNQIKMELGSGYHIIAIKDPHDIAISVYYLESIVGKARIITDNVDVECITSITLDDKHITTIFAEKYLLGEIFIKFLMKFPSMVRKPEFRFVCNPPDNLKTMLEQYHFNSKSGVNSEIMIRNAVVLPMQKKISEEINITSTIEPDKKSALLSFLQKNAYWQSHLTRNRLDLLLDNSECFFVTKYDQIIGFSRVMTDKSSFASLWDVVIDEAYRSKGIGTNLMLKIFSDDILCKIPHWVLFTDTAKKFYEQFGFVSETELINRKVIHKLRLQAEHPEYMNELLKLTNTEFSVSLDEKHSMAFLFENKRAQLYSFWKNVPDSSCELGQREGKEREVLLNFHIQK